MPSKPKGAVKRIQKRAELREKDLLMGCELYEKITEEELAKMFGKKKTPKNPPETLLKTTGN